MYVLDTKLYGYLQDVSRAYEIRAEQCQLVTAGHDEVRFNLPQRTTTRLGPL